MEPNQPPCRRNILLVYFRNPFLYRLNTKPSRLLNLSFYKVGSPMFCTLFLCNSHTYFLLLYLFPCILSRMSLIPLFLYNLSIVLFRLQTPFLDNLNMVLFRVQNPFLYNLNIVLSHSCSTSITPSNTACWLSPPATAHGRGQACTESSGSRPSPAPSAAHRKRPAPA